MQTIIADSERTAVPQYITLVASLRDENTFQSGDFSNIERCVHIK